MPNKGTAASVLKGIDYLVKQAFSIRTKEVLLTVIDAKNAGNNTDSNTNYANLLVAGEMKLCTIQCMHSIMLLDWLYTQYCNAMYVIESVRSKHALLCKKS